MLSIPIPSGKFDMAMDSHHLIGKTIGLNGGAWRIVHKRTKLAEGTNDIADFSFTEFMARYT